MTRKFKIKRMTNVQTVRAGPGTATDHLSRHYEHQLYQQHLKNLANVKAKVDNRPPKLSAHMYIKLGKMRATQNRVHTVQNENKKLVFGINQVYRSKGKTDCYHTKTLSVSGNFNARMAGAVMIMRENREILKRILYKEPTIVYSDLMKDWERNKTLMELKSRYPMPWMKISSYDKLEGVCNHREKGHLIALSPCSSMTRLRRRCYFEVEADDGISLGRLEFMVYSDVVPKTALNFLALCNGYKDLTYRGSKFVRIVPGLYCQGGDITKNNGSGGMSIFGEIFPDENFHLKHGCAGALAMANTTNNSNSSQFTIDFRHLPTLNGSSVVLGKVIKGIKTLRRIEQYGSKSGIPYNNVYIADCGLLY